MASQLFSTFTEVGLVDTRVNAGTITLPKTIDIPYRQISLKDIYGNFQNKTLTLNTQFPDTFEDATTTKVLSNAFGFTTLYAGGNNVWYTVGGTVLTSQTVSSLTVSSIIGNGGNLVNLPAISSLSLQSTVTGLGLIYISTASFISTTFALQTAGFVSAPNLLGHVSTSTLNLSLTSTVAALTYGYQAAGFISTATIQSTTAGLLYGYQTAGFVSAPNLLNHVSTAFLNTTIQSTTAGLGQIYVSTVAAAVNQSNITSTVQGLGTVGYVSSFSSFSTLLGLSTSISTLTTQYFAGTQAFISSLIVNSLSLGSNTSFIDMGDIIAASLSTTQINTTALYATGIYTSSLQASTIIGALTTANLTSTTLGLQMSGFISTATIQSTTQGLITSGFVSSPNLLGHISTAFLNTSLQSTTTGLGLIYVSTLTLNSSLVSTTAGIYTYISSFIDPTELTSTVIGLGTTGYVSTMGLLSTASGLASYITTFIDPVELASTVAGLGSASFISSLQLQLNITSTVAGLGTVGYISAANLLGHVSTSTLTISLTSTVQGLGSATYISSAHLASTITGLGSSSYISSSQLTSTITGLASSSYISSSQLTSTVTGLGLIYISTLALTSTVQGLGSATYVSTGHIISTGVSYSNYFTSLSAGFSTIFASNGYISSLRVDSLQLGLGDGWADFGPLRAPAMSTLQLNAGAVYATSNFVGSVSTPFNAIQFYGLFGQYNNTVLAEVSTGVGTQELLFFKGSSASDRIRLQTTGNIVFEPGSSARLWASSITSNVTPAMIINTSSNVGIQTASPQTTLDVAGTGRFQIASTLAMNVSTVNGFIPWQPSYLTSTVVGVTYAYQTSGFISTATIQSTTLGLQMSGFISTPTIQSTTAGIFYAYQTAGIISTPTIQSTTAGLLYGYQTAGFISAPNLLNHVSTTFLNTTIQSTTAGLGQIYVSTVAAAISQSNLTSTVVGLGTVGYVSSFSTFSTLIGLSTSISTLTSQYLYGTQGFISSLTVNSLFLGATSGFIDLGDMIATTISTGQLNATVIYASSIQALQISGATTTGNLVSTVAGITIAYQRSGFISTATIQSTTLGLQMSGFISTPTIQSTVIGLGQIYVSTIQLTSTTAGIYNYVSTSFIDSTENLSTVTGLGSANYISTVSLTSTVRGLGSSSYISSTQVISTGASYATYFTTLSASFSSVTASNVFASTLIVNNLQIGTGLGWVNIGPLQTVALSTTQVQAGSVYATSNFFGSVSTPYSAVQFYGLLGQYNNTVLSEVSTGVGTQELLLFKGSSTSDRIRLQTTGNIVFEPGSSARLWASSITSNVIPAMIINTSSNVGIGTASPSYKLDVIGTTRSQIVVAQPSGTTSATSVSPLAVTNGNAYLSFSPQIEFQYNTGGFKHFMGSRHQDSVANSFGNAIDFWLYSASSGGSNASTTPGTCNVNTMSVTAAGVGIFNNSPVFSLDVASTVRFQGVSTLNIQLSSINGLTFGGPINSTVIGLGSAGYISTAGLTQSNVTSSINSLLIPYSTLNTNTYFQVKASSTQLYYGTVGSTAQVYVGDLLAASGDITTTNPLLLMEQLPFTYSGGTSNISYSGSSTTFTVPAGITSINVTLSGAGGGGGNGFAQTGGAGGYVSGTLAVTPGESLTLIVGGRGVTGSPPSGGFGGGGLGGQATYSGGGGGRTAIQRAGADIVTAGGGGGAGQGNGAGFPYGNGGAGGGTTGANGGVSANGGGGGGGQSSGGAGGSGGGAGTGTLGAGGAGASGFNGGGGSGYWGGGGATGNQGGGGGSSYVANLTGTVVNTQGGGAAQNVSGSMTISWSAPPAIYRPGNILEIRNYLLNKTIIDPNLNMGINVSSITSGFQFDVNGAARATSLSTQNIQLSSINGLTFGGPINSTVIGLGTTGYVSTTQLNVSLTSTVSGLGNAGYVSTASLFSTVAGSGPLFASTVAGLGTAGYVSTASLISTVSGSGSLFVSTVKGLGTAGYISSAVSQSNVTSSINSLLIPYSTLNTDTYFQIKASSTQLYYGKVGSTSQIYVGDVQAANGNTTATNPLLLMEQTPIISSQVTQSISYSGADSNFVVPAGVTSVFVVMTGAGGGGKGGNGGYVSGTLAVTPAETLVVVVGQGGNYGTYPYGGAGGAGSYGYGNSGGGRSAIRRSGADIVTAGGGGGGSAHNGYGGAGGGTTGATGASDGFASGGTGGSQSSGGSPGGGLGYGGGSPDYGGGGGGGGYYGGGGGNQYSSGYSAGGGGSSYVSNLTGSVTDTQGGGGAGSSGFGAGTNGSVTITYTPPPNYRPGNILEVRNYQLNKIIIDPLLSMGINVSSITSGFQFDVNGASRAVSMSTQNIQVSSINGVIGINASTSALTLDVYGVGRMGMPVSSITGSVATFGTKSYGIYYYISNSAFSNITLTSVTAFTGWFVTLRNNTGTTLSVTVTGQTNSTPASPFSIAASNATTIAYDTNYNSGGTAGYAFF